MKILKTACALSVLTGLLLGLAPQPGTCQMSRKAVSCAMPCCPGQMPVSGSSCPMVQPAAPQDAISLSSYKVAPALHVVDSLVLLQTATLDHRASAFDAHPSIPRTDTCRTPQSIP